MDPSIAGAPYLMRRASRHLIATKLGFRATTFDGYAVQSQQRAGRESG